MKKIGFSSGALLLYLKMYPIPSFISTVSTMLWGGNVQTSHVFWALLESLVFKERHLDKWYTISRELCHCAIFTCKWEKQSEQVAEAEWVSDGEKGINTPLKLVAAGWDAWKSFYCPWCWLNLLSLFPETQALSPLELKWLMLLRWWVGILFDSGTPFDHDKLSSESDIESGPVALKLLLMSKLSSCHLCISELPLGAIVCVHAREGLCVWVFFRLLPLTVYHVSM